MEPVFQAIAEPTRRALLARLRSAPELTLGELSDPLAMTRQAVSKHLDVLAGAGLIEVQWRGREKFHRLNAAPLREVGDWLAPYAAAWDRRLERLERHLEENA